MEGVQEQRVDEIKNYLSARYVGSMEAAWRLFQFPLTGRSHTVFTLPVHLENGQRVYFKTVEAAEEAALKPPPCTELTQWLIFNQENEANPRRQFRCVFKPKP